VKYNAQHPAHFFQKSAGDGRPESSRAGGREELERYTGEMQSANRDVGIGGNCGHLTLEPLLPAE